MGKLSIIREFGQFLWINKVWWMAPIVVALLLLGVFIVLSQSSAVTPFIYTLF